MPVIDMHAHVTPERYKKAIAETGSWYGLDSTVGELGLGGFSDSVETRLAGMDRDGVDMQLLSANAGFYQYFNDLETTKAVARECNEEIAEMVVERPDRFMGLANVPMQDVSSAIAEMEYGMNELGLKGVMINDSAAGATYDELKFLPFFKAAEELGAIVFFHQGGGTLITHRIERYKLGNSVGNLTERALVFAALVFGGVMDKCPDLKPLLAHGGGYTPYGAVRMDKVCGALDRVDPNEPLTPRFARHPEEHFDLRNAPTDYLDKFHYDCCTYSGPILRFLVDTVGIDQVVLGTDTPAPMVLPDPVNWIRTMAELTDVEKEAILVGNPMALCGL
ncbi:MAG: amidohydrolase family protein [Acidimicrobiales bacterium]